MPDRMDAEIEEAPRPAPPKPLASWYAQGSTDGLGDRLLMFDNSDAPSLELLRFHPHLAQVPGFEAALREQVQRLAEFQHPAFARVRSVQRLEPDDDLALISNYTPGKRLSEILHRARGPAFAAAIIRQLAPALALFQQHAAGTSHGVLDPDRIVVSPEGRLTIVEHVVGRAIETLDAPQLSSIGVALPPGEDGAAPRAAAATDWYQLGLVAASVLIGRPATPADLPEVERLLDELDDSADPDGTQLSPFIRQWLGRTLQLSGERIASEADGAALEEFAPEQAAASPTTVVPREQGIEPAPAVADAVHAGAPPGIVETRAPKRNVQSARHDVPRITQAPPPAPPSLRSKPPDESLFEGRRPVAGTSRPEPKAQPRESTNPLSMFERETFAGKTSLPEFGRVQGVHDRPPTTLRTFESSDEPRTFSFKVVAALAVLAVIEAGVIGWMARAAWLAPRPSVVAQTTASGEKLLPNAGASSAASLGLMVAADLSWARVTSPSADATAGTKAIAPGTMRISAPIDLKVFEGSRLLGSVPGGDIKLAAGRHEIALENTPLAYRLMQTVEIEAGETVSLHIAQPHGMVTIDASPWADVSIDGRPAGRTPLGPLPLALGEHEITFRHPAGSNDRQRVRVKPEGITRVMGNLRF